MKDVLLTDGAAVTGHPWMATLVSVLGLYQVILSLHAGSAIMVSGIIGGILVAASPWVMHRSTTLGAAMLVVGTLVWATLAWWSIIAPLTAIVALGIGGYVLLQTRALTRQRSSA